MSISSLQHRIQKRVELQQYKTDYRDIGSFIKRKRKELNVTQDEISNGICSISYLSKIENNQIVPSEFYIKEIMNKLDIDQAIYTKSIKDREYVTNTIRHFFYLDDVSISTLYQDIKDIEHNLVINLCKLGYNVYFQHEDDNQYVMMLEHLVANMSDLDIQVYLLFSAQYFLSHQKYKTALELILLQESLPQQNDYLIGMFHELAYIVKQRLHITNSANEDYHSAMHIFTKHHNMKRIVRLALSKVESIREEHPKKALRMLESIKSDGLEPHIKDQYYYLRSLIQFSLRRFQEATVSLKKIQAESIYYMRKMTLLLQICRMEDDYDMIEEIRKILESYTPNVQEMSTKIYYHYLTQDDKNDQKDYLRNIAIPFSIKIEDYKHLKQYTDDIMQLCIDGSRYKEAMQHYNRYQKEMHKIQQLLY